MGEKTIHSIVETVDSKKYTFTFCKLKISMEQFSKICFYLLQKM